MHRIKTYQTACLLSSVFMLSPIYAWANDPNLSSAPVTTPAENQQDILNQIPRFIDATPTLFPAQSDHSIVPPSHETENNSWADRKQKALTTWTDTTAKKIDDWFGEVDPQRPASATLRVLLDSTWNKYDDYDIEPRIRGKIRLPTLERKLSVVFGDDSLDNEMESNSTIRSENLSHSSDKTIDSKRTRESNSSLAIRWSELSQKLPFDTDVDLGLRSGDDLYLRLKASKDWQLDNDFQLHAEQIYRYGIDSKNYFRTNLELAHMRSNHPILANQVNLTYADAQEDDLTWDNYTFRQHQFFHGNRFSYGVYTGGYLNARDLRLNSWGPYVSWRQPFLREWFYIQGDLNYFNDQREDRQHFASAALRLEALF